MILTPLQKLSNNVRRLGKIIIATGFECLPKKQKIAQSGHTAHGPEQGAAYQCSEPSVIPLSCPGVLVQTDIEKILKGSRHSSVDSSASTIPGSSPKHTIYAFIIFVLYLSCEEDENKLKEAGFGPFFKISYFRNWEDDEVAKVFI